MSSYLACEGSERDGRSQVHEEVYILLLACDYSVGLIFNFHQPSFPFSSDSLLFVSLSSQPHSGYDSVKLMDNSGVFITIWIFFSSPSQNLEVSVLFPHFLSYSSMRDLGSCSSDLHFHIPRALSLCLHQRCKLLLIA